VPWREILKSEKATRRARSRSTAPALTADDISNFSHALAAARGQFGKAVKSLASDYDLGQRGPWIIGIVGRIQVSPHQLADFFSVGRSLITAELTKLEECGFIALAKDENDGRRTNIALTPTGREVYDRLGRDMEAFLAERLAGYTVEEVRLCARLLADFSLPTSA